MSKSQATALLIFVVACAVLLLAIRVLARRQTHDTEKPVSYGEWLDKTVWFRGKPHLIVAVSHHGACAIRRIGTSTHTFWVPAKNVPHVLSFVEPGDPGE